MAQTECPECDKFEIAGIYDIPPTPQAPGGNYFILLLTLNEDLDTGFDPFYADLIFIKDNGDTLTVLFGPTQTLPKYRQDTIPYIMKIDSKQSNLDFPEDFDGVLRIVKIPGLTCPDTKHCDIDPDPTTSIIEFEHSDLSNFSVYPNPASNCIEIISEHQLCELSIFDLRGCLIKSLHNTQSSKRIYIGDLLSGTYVIQCKSSIGIGSNIIIKN